jgi:hypothetical protein
MKNSFFYMLIQAYLIRNFGKSLKFDLMVDSFKSE